MARRGVAGLGEGGVSRLRKPWGQWSNIRFVAQLRQSHPAAKRRFAYRAISG